MKDTGIGKMFRLVDYQSKLTTTLDKFVSEGALVNTTLKING